MHNWSTAEEQLKNHPEQHAHWRLEQLINFGLGDEKLNMEELKKSFRELEIDTHRKKFLALLIHGE